MARMPRRTGPWLPGDRTKRLEDPRRLAKAYRTEVEIVMTWLLTAHVSGREKAFDGWLRSSAPRCPRPP